MIGLPNPDQRSVAQTSGFPHPYIYTYTARALLLERTLALRGEGITWMGQPSRQGIRAFFGAHRILAKHSRLLPRAASALCGANSLTKTLYAWRACSMLRFQVVHLEGLSALLGGR